MCPGTLVSYSHTHIRRRFYEGAPLTQTDVLSSTHTKPHATSFAPRCILLFASWTLSSALYSVAFSSSALQHYLNGCRRVEQFCPILLNKSTLSSHKAGILCSLVALWLVLSTYTKESSLHKVVLSWTELNGPEWIWNWAESNSAKRSNSHCMETSWMDLSRAKVISICLPCGGCWRWRSVSWFYAVSLHHIWIVLLKCFFLWIKVIA